MFIAIVVSVLNACRGVLIYPNKVFEDDAAVVPAAWKGNVISIAIVLLLLSQQKLDYQGLSTR